MYTGSESRRKGVFMIKKIALATLLLTATVSVSAASSTPSERQYNYLESGLGVANVDTAGSGIYLGLGGSGTFNNFIISGQFSTDLDSKDASVSRMGLGYYWSLANDSDLVVDYRTSKISLKAANGAVTTVKEESISLGFSNYVNDNSSLMAMLVIPLSVGGANFGLSGNYWIDNTTAINLSYDPSNTASTTSITLRYSPQN